MQIAGKVIFGILLPTAMFPYAIGALLFGIAVEYAVYKISIREGAALPDDLKLVLKKKIAEREIKKLKETKFGQFYDKKSNQLEHLLKLKSHYSKGLINPLLYEERDKQQIEKRIVALQHTLRHMKKALIQSIESGHTCLPGLDKKLFEEKTITQLNLKNEINDKVSKYKLFIKLFTYGAGLTQFLITTGSLIGVFGCFPVAALIGILAGGGCLYQMRGTLTEIILANWKEKIEEILPHPPSNEEDSTLKKYGKKMLFLLKMASVVVIVLGLFALSLVALIAGSEAWVKFTTDGLHALPYLIMAGGKILSVTANTLVYGLFFFPSLVFNVLNEVEAFFDLGKRLWENSKNFFRNVWQISILNQIRNTWNYTKENDFYSFLKDFWFVFLKNLIQFVNPAALCLKSFNVLLLVGHAISNSLSTDESTHIPIQTNIITNFTTELISDANFILDSEDESQEHESKAQESEKQEKTHYQPQSHHNDKGIFFNFIEDILRVTSFAWHFFWGIFFSFNLQESLQEAKEKFFPVKSLEEQDNSLPNTPLPLNHDKNKSVAEKKDLKNSRSLQKTTASANEEDIEKSWILFQIKQQLDNKISKLENELKNEKKNSTSLISEKLRLIKDLKEKNNNTDIPQLKKAIEECSQRMEFFHRHQISKILSICFFSVKPTTQKFLESLVDTIDYLPQAPGK